VNAERSGRSMAPRLIVLAVAWSVSACSWFTDFKQQPKIDPWETAADSIPFRGNPQGSVSIYGSAAPGFIYDRAPTPQNAAAMANISNPIPADSASVNRGRINFQINCAVCHGPRGAGMGNVSKYGPLYPPAIGTAASAAAGYTDGYIFGVIRNGKGLMPTYNRIEEPDRWDIINYLRTLQGKGTIAADTSHGRPGETGSLVPNATQMGPTRPAPYYGHPGAMAPSAARTAAAPASATADTVRKTPADTSATTKVSNTTKKPEQQP
jgi:mono/diheme cytochrome c family protein